MTWQGKRRAQLPSDWAALRQARLELDGYRCTAPISRIYLDDELEVSSVDRLRCPRDATDVHHANGPHDHRVESLRSLCSDCHKAETQREAQQAQGRGASRLRPRRPHPGLVQ